MSASGAAGESPSSSARQDTDAPHPAAPGAQAESPSAGKEAGSSSAGQVAPQRNWVALVSTPRILAADDERARAMAHDAFFDLDLDDPPKPSYLVLHPRIVAPDPGNSAQQAEGYAYVLAVHYHSSVFLFGVTNPGGDDPADERETLYLCSTFFRKAITLPAAPYSDLGVEVQPRRSVGFILIPPAQTNNPNAIRGHYLVAQLCPRPHDDNLLCFSTAEEARGWFLKPLHTTTAVPTHNLCGVTRVLAHQGRFYWINLAYGIFFCDPFAEPSLLRFVPLPDDCRVWEVDELSEVNRANVARRRRVAPSDGLLRYVEIGNLSYDLNAAVAPPPPVDASVRMWTLVDPEAVQPWRFEYELEAPLSEVRAHPSYSAFGLPDGEVPRVAFVDPDNHRIVYFLQGCILYGVDLGSSEVVSCEDCRERASDIIDAREWSLAPKPYSPGGEGEHPSAALKIDWDELKNPHPEVERVGFRHHIAHLTVPNPLRAILPIAAAPLSPQPGPDARREDLRRAIGRVQQAISDEPSYKKRKKFVRNLKHLRDMLGKI